MNEQSLIEKFQIFIKNNPKAYLLFAGIALLVMFFSILGVVLGTSIHGIGFYLFNSFLLVFIIGCVVMFIRKNRI